MYFPKGLHLEHYKLQKNIASAILQLISLRETLHYTPQHLNGLKNTVLEFVE